MDKSVRFTVNTRFGRILHPLVPVLVQPFLHQLDYLPHWDIETQYLLLGKISKLHLPQTNPQT
jgi:hypothetical protein